jgi:hypothetical protein
MVELAETIRIVGFPVALAAWCYCVYCCNVIERRRAHNAGPLPLAIWFLADLPLDLVKYRSRFFVSTVVFVWALVISRTVTVLAGLG